METLNKKPIPDNHNDDSNLHNDELGENSGADTLIAKEAELKPGEIGIDKMDSSNKGQGPTGEGL